MKRALKSWRLPPGDSARAIEGKNEGNDLGKANHNIQVSLSFPYVAEEAFHDRDPLSSPGIRTPPKPTEKDPRQLLNLAALDIWKSYIEEEEQADKAAAEGLWNQLKETLAARLKGRGLTEHQARAKGWAMERALVAEVEKLLKEGTTPTISSALYLIAKGMVPLPGKGAAWLRERSRGYLGYDRHSDPGLITRLIRYTRDSFPDAQKAKLLLEETFANLESKDAAVQTAFAIYALVRQLSPQAEIQQEVQGHLKALQGQSTFRRAAEKFLYSLNPTEVGINVGLMFVSGGLGNLAKLLAMKKLEQAGVAGFKAVAAASAAGFTTETVALGSFNNLQQVLTQDPGRITVQDIADHYKKAASMIGFVKFFGNVGRMAAPALAKALGFTTEQGLTWGGKALTWGVGHTGGLGGMMASSRLHQARDWQPSPLGGEKETLVNDLLGYVEFSVAQGLAHGAVNAMTQGKLSAFRQRQRQILAEQTAKLISPTPGRPAPALSALGAGATILLIPELAHAMTPMARGLAQENSGGLLPGLAAATVLLGAAISRSGKRSKMISESPTEKMEVREELGRLQREHERISNALKALLPQLPEKIGAKHLEGLRRLSERQEFWELQLRHLQEEPEKERKDFERDIQIGLQILGHRLFSLGAEILQEPLNPGDRPALGLTSRFQEENPPPPLREKGPTSLPSGPEGIFPALVNRDVGIGRTLSLRPHQVAALHRIRGRLALREAQLKDLNEGEKLPRHFLSGTIVMPVGGGKTRVMIAGFAAAIEKGLFQAKRGDKLLVLNHTDQIHEQNLKVTALLEPYFKKKFGRPLRVSEYKAEAHDLSGDVVVVSVPSVNNEGRRISFSQELKKALGPRGNIAMVAVDEVHHVEMGRGKGKETWLQLLSALRKTDPHFYRIGFTATPTGREATIFKVSERELMQRGVTPRTYLVHVKGKDLSQLKVAAGTGDFVTGKLVSTLLRYPERNTRIYESLETHGLKKENPSPSGKAQLEGTLGFAADLRHARMMAEDYQNYFARENGAPLHGRQLTVLGESKGKITRAELQRALKNYRSGEIDGIVAIVSGVTKGQKDPVLQAVKRGEIEAVFSVDALVEGADLYMFTHQLGARPTFSRTKKGQERGRINRRDPEEVSPQGQVFQDKPRILFDIVDRYDSYERSLVRYGEVMGIAGHAGLDTNQLFDALAGEVVDQVDRSGTGVPRPGNKKIEMEPPSPPRPKASQDSPWTSLIRELKTVLTERYEEDLESLATDLGESEAFVARLLQGEGWENNRSFLKRLATLLYQERGKFLTVYNQARGMRDETVTASDYAMLRGALALVEAWEGPIGEGGLEVKGNWDWGPEEIHLGPKSLRRLSDETLGDASFRNLCRTLLLYFKTQSEGKAEEPAGQDSGKKFEELNQHFFQREGWALASGSRQEELLLMARRGVALRFGGSLPVETGIEEVTQQGERAPLTRWLKGEKIDYGKTCTPQLFYGQIRALLKGLGVSKPVIDAKIEAAVFEERGWQPSAKTQREELLLTARRGVALHFGGGLLKDPGLQGVSPQSERAFLTRWLKGEKISYTKGASLKASYDQIRALLRGLGHSKREIDAKIEAAVFEERGWIRSAKTKQEELLLLARKRVARVLGGTLPQNLEIEGLSQQNEKSPLSRWLQGEKMESKAGFSVQQFYEQIRALLRGLGVSEAEIESKIEAAIFEEQGWKPSAGNRQADLLLLARRRVARVFGGVLPTQPGIEGVPLQREGAPLTRWLRGEKLEYLATLTPQLFYDQIRALLKGAGVPVHEIQTKVEAAIFEERGWNNAAATSQEKILRLGRQKAAKSFGGVLPRRTGIEGVPPQHEKATLTRWLNGEKLSLDENLVSQIRALLLHDSFMDPEGLERLGFPSLSGVGSRSL